METVRQRRKPLADRRVRQRTPGLEAFAMRVLTGHRSSRPVCSLAFYPDGTRLASCGGDHTVRLWDLITSESQTLSHDPRRPPRSVAFAPDGTLAVGVTWAVGLLAPGATELEVIEDGSHRAF